MRDDFIRLTRVAQIEVLQGDIAANLQNILDQIAVARHAGCSLLVFPELAVTGILEANLWKSDSGLWQRCLMAHEQIVAASCGMAVIFGSVAAYNGCYVNAVWAAENGRVVLPEGSPLSFVPRFVGRGGRFDQFCGFVDGWYLAGRENLDIHSLAAPFVFSGGRVGAWSGCGSDNAAVVSVLQGRKVDLLVSLCNVAFERELELWEPAGWEGLFVQCGACGVVDAGKVFFTLAGGSCMHQAGRVAETELFQEKLLQLDTAATPLPDLQSFAGYAAVANAFEYGLRRILQYMGVERVVVGASGGIDSALSAAIYSRVVAPENLMLVNMPSRFSSSVTVRLAEQLAANLGCGYCEIPIEQSINNTVAQIKGVRYQVKGVKGSFQLGEGAVENIQARDRTTRVLAAVSSALGGVYTCNSNKSECTVGYGTMYGDMAGFLAILADLWKTEVWELSRFYNKSVFGREIIPQGSIDIIPTAELSDAQSVAAGIGDPLVYGWHDRLFAAWVERVPIATPEALAEWYQSGQVEQALGYSGNVRELFPTLPEFKADVDRVWGLYQGLSHVKRLLLPPVFALKGRTFGFDLPQAPSCFC